MEIYEILALCVPTSLFVCILVLSFVYNKRNHH